MLGDETHKGALVVMTDGSDVRKRLPPTDYLDIRREFSSERLHDVQAAFDPLTATRLESIGICEGWTCLIVGGGRAAMARWISSRIGPSGRVVVADADMSLDSAKPSEFETRPDDIRTGPVDGDAYDVAHSRHLLMAMKEPQPALEHMVASLRPGGWLVVEEGDFDEPAVVTREHPAAGAFERVWHAMTVFLSGSMDVRYGTRLPRIGSCLGLDDFRVESTRTYSPGGEPGPMAMKLAMDMFRDQLLASTAHWEDDLVLATAALEDPSFVCGTPMSYAVFGRKR